MVELGVVEVELGSVKVELEGVEVEPGEDEVELRGEGVTLAGDFLVTEIKKNRSVVGTIEKATAQSAGFVVGIPPITGTSIQNGDCWKKRGGEVWGRKVKIADNGWRIKEVAEGNFWKSLISLFIRCLVTYDAGYPIHFLPHANILPFL